MSETEEISRNDEFGEKLSKVISLICVAVWAISTLVTSTIPLTVAPGSRFIS